MKLQISLIAFAIAGFALQTNAQTVKQTKQAPITNALSTVVKLDPITFSYDQNWADQLKINSGSQNGFDLEALAKTAPNLVINQQRNYTSGKNATKTAVVQKVDYEALMPLLVGSIKEQQKQIEALKAELSDLKTKRTE
jgi:ABC-type enterochelin transport system substrate-binding protein